MHMSKSKVGQEKKQGKKSKGKQRQNSSCRFTLSYRKMGLIDHNQLLHTY